VNARTTKTPRTKRGKVTSLPTPATVTSRTGPSSAGPSPAADLGPNSLISHSVAFIEPEQREAMIAEAAYYRAEHRGFDSGHEFEDWIAAEAEIDGMLARREVSPGCGT